MKRDLFNSVSGRWTVALQEWREPFRVIVPAFATFFVQPAHTTFWGVR